jgi:ribonuclease HI
MKFILANIFVSNNSIVENYFDQEVLKEMPFNSKVTTKLPGGNKDISYDLVMFPLLEVPNQRTQEELLLADKINSKIHYGENFTYEVLYSVISLFKTKPSFDLEKVSFEINILGIIDEKNYDITYTDGSFKQSTKEASYGVVKLLEESQNGLYEEFTKAKYSHKEYSAKFPDGSNNIGELKGLKFAIDNFSDKKYQLLISDSEYGIKCFREWYYTWKDNNFKNYAKKIISNKDLILDIYESMKNSGKIILFKWVKGHSTNTINEMCDELAKKVLL